MAWTIKYTNTAKRELNKLDKNIARSIFKHIESKIAFLEDPRMDGKALVGNLQGLWSYKYKTYRINCEIQDDVLIILVVRIGHRRNVYE